MNCVAPHLNPSPSPFCKISKVARERELTGNRGFILKKIGAVIVFVSSVFMGECTAKEE